MLPPRPARQYPKLFNHHARGLGVTPPQQMPLTLQALVLGGTDGHARRGQILPKLDFHHTQRGAILGKDVYLGSAALVINLQQPIALA